MSASQVASRYARSLLVLALEQGHLEAVHEDMLLIKKTVVDNKDLRLMLDSPIVKSEQKEKVLKAIFTGKIGELSMKFIEILVQKRREDLIDDMAAEFERQYMGHKGVITAEVISVEKLNPSQRDEVLRIIKGIDDKKVELSERLDPSIIGGLIIRIGDKQLDLSVEGKLRTYRSQLVRNNG